MREQTTTTARRKSANVLRIKACRGSSSGGASQEGTLVAG